LKEEPDNFTALWRNSFLHSRVGDRQEDEDDQERYFEEAIALAERALEVDPDHPESNYAMAVAMGRKALISGAKDRVAASRDIKKYTDRTLELDSTHAGAWHVLGRWHLKVANLSWVERAAANTLFGGLPKGASNEKAAESIQKAIELKGDYPLYYYDLALVYEEMGQDEQAIETCRQALEIESTIPGTDKIKEDCRKLIDDLQ
jgi:tetratricopeptide (TPR) repeat protein